MSAKYTIQPPDLNECKSYEAFKRKLKAWADVTDLTKKKQGNFIALSLPNKSKFGDDLRERAFEKLSLGELKEDNGLDKLIEFLDEELGKNAVDEIIEKWEEFDNCKRAANQTIDEFSNDFEAKYNRIKQSGSKIPEEILAYMMMKRAGLTHVEKMLVISRIDMEDKENLFKKFKIHMKNILGKSFQNQKTKATDEITIEPAFLAEHEEVLATHGYYRNRSNTDPSSFKKPGFRKSFPQSHHKSSVNAGQVSRTDRGGRPINPNGKDGKTLLCRGCGSFRHFLQDCQYSHEKKGSKDVLLTEEVREAAIQNAEVERFVL